MGKISDEAKLQFICAYKSLASGFANLKTGETVTSQQGFIKGDFLYWLIDDESCNELNLEILIK
jgi:hypothetical protein